MMSSAQIPIGSCACHPKDSAGGHGLALWRIVYYSVLGIQDAVAANHFIPPLPTATSLRSPQPPSLSTRTTLYSPPGPARRAASPTRPRTLRRSRRRRILTPSSSTAPSGPTATSSRTTRPSLVRSSSPACASPRPVPPWEPHGWWAESGMRPAMFRGGRRAGFPGFWSLR
jgi:hypothetical protein